jgi:hypothetical protein
MSNAKPDKTLVTAQDFTDYLWDLFCKKRYCRIENDFHFGYDRALNDVMYHVKYASPESEHCTCAECALESQTMTTVKDVLDYLFCEIQQMRSDPPENDFQRGYEKAFSDLMYQVFSASPKSAKSEYVLRKIPEGCSEGAKVIDLADARRDRGSRSSEGSQG